MASKKKRRRRRAREGAVRMSAPGTAPGTIEVSADAEKPKIRVIAYDGSRVEEKALATANEVRPYLDRWPTVWVNVDGLGDAAMVKRLGEIFAIHPLALEDVVHVHQRAKVEPYDSNIFVVVRMGRIERRFESEQVSLFVGDRYILTFQEKEGDCFEPVRERLRVGRPRIRNGGPSYLAYALIDAVVDAYFPLLEAYGARLDDLEDRVAAEHSTQHAAEIHELRGELLELRRCLRPHRDAVGLLIRDEHPLITEEARVFLRDCADHALQAVDLVDSYRDICSGIRDYYLANVSNRMNEVMKVLTIIATIFIPLSFITGLYGMNFDTSSPWNMPELAWRYGYPAALFAMAATVGGLIWFFRKRGWLGAR